MESKSADKSLSDLTRKTAQSTMEKVLAAEKGFRAGQIVAATPITLKEELRILPFPLLGLGSSRDRPLLETGLAMTAMAFRGPAGPFGAFG